MQSYRLTWTTRVHKIWKAETKLQHDSCFARKVSEGQPPAHIDAYLLARFVGQQLSQSTFSPHRIFPFSNSSSQWGAQSALWRRAQRSQSWRCRGTVRFWLILAAPSMSSYPPFTPILHSQVPALLTSDGVWEAETTASRLVINQLPHFCEAKSLNNELNKE